MRTPLAALLPIRDRRDRTVGFELSTAPVSDIDTADATDDNTRDALDLIPTFTRLAGRSLLVPVTPGIVRDGSLARFASMDVVMLLATDALDDAMTRRAAERLMTSGIRFALDGFPEGNPLPPALGGAIVAIDGRRTAPDLLASQLRVLLDAGLRPLVRGVDDRATRLRILAQGGALYTGRLLTRAASVPVDDESGESIVRAIEVLARLSDGRQPDAAFDRYIEGDARMSAALLRSVAAAAFGVRNPRSVSHAIALLGRDAVLDSLAIATSRLMGEVAHDTELSHAALRRVHLCDQLGAAMDPAPHPRARIAAALLSVAEFPLAEPPAVLFEHRFHRLPAGIRDTLVHRRQPLGQLVDLAEAMDNGWWSDLRARCRALGISPGVVSTAYGDAWRKTRDDLATAQRMD